MHVIVASFTDLFCLHFVMTSNLNKSWSLGLLTTLKDAKNHIISSETAVVINDKFPKAKYHFLVLPKEDISSIFKVTF